MKSSTYAIGLFGQSGFGSTAEAAGPKFGGLPAGTGGSVLCRLTQGPALAPRQDL
jgi:hypothetical protein